MAITRQFFGRLIYEFMSPRWFVAHERSTVIRVVESAPEAALAGAPVLPMDDMAATFEGIPKLLERSYHPQIWQSLPIYVIMSDRRCLWPP